MLPVARLLVSASFLLGGCGEADRTLVWRLSFEPASEEARIAAVEARVLRGGCDSSAETWRQRWTREEMGAAMEVPALEPGTYSFVARGADAACNFVVAGCTTVELPINDGATVEVILRPDAGGMDPACGEGACPLPPAWDESVDWASGETFWVDGRASGTTGTEDDPVPQMLDALVLAQGVTDRPVTVIVKSGTHSTSTSFDASLLQRTAEAPLRILGEDGAGFDNPEPGTTSAAFYMLGASYVVVENLSFRGGVSPFRIDADTGFDNHHIVLRDLVVPGDDDSECIRLYNLRDVHVIGSETIGCEIGLRLLRVRNGWALGNTFRDAAGVGVSVEGSSEDVLIHGNQLLSLGGFGVVLGGSAIRPAGATHEAHRVYVVGNILRSIGASDTGSMLFGSCDGCVFAHNTMIDPQAFITRILQTSDAPGPSQDGLFVNNLIVFDVTDVIGYVNLDERVDAAIAPETYTYGWNLFVPNDTSFAGFTTPSPVPPDTTSTVVESAGFVDPGGTEPSSYRLAAGSPARGAGMAFEYGTFDPPDFRSLCFAMPPSIGAFEEP